MCEAMTRRQERTEKGVPSWPFRLAFQPISWALTRIMVLPSNIAAPVTSMAALNRVPLPVLNPGTSPSPHVSGVIVLKAILVAANSYAFNLGMRTTRFEELGDAVIQAVLTSLVLNPAHVASTPTLEEDVRTPQCCPRFIMHSDSDSHLNLHLQAVLMTLSGPMNLATWARQCNIALSDASEIIAARAFACYIGAIYDHHGGKVVEEFIAALINPAEINANEAPSRKRKTSELNERVQKRHRKLKFGYDMSGTMHRPTWTCTVKGVHFFLLLRALI